MGRGMLSSPITPIEEGTNGPRHIARHRQPRHRVPTRRSSRESPIGGRTGRTRALSRFQPAPVSSGSTHRGLPERALRRPRSGRAAASSRRPADLASSWDRPCALAARGGKQLPHADSPVVPGAQWRAPQSPERSPDDARDVSHRRRGIADSRRQEGRAATVFAALFRHAVNPPGEFAIVPFTANRLEPLRARSSRCCCGRSCGRRCPANARRPRWRSASSPPAAW